MGRKHLLATVFVVLLILLSTEGISFIYSVSANPVPSTEPEYLSNLWLATWIAGVAAAAVTLGVAFAFSFLRKMDRRKHQ